MSLYAFGRVVCAPIAKIIYRTKYINKNNIPEQGAFILACNHISNTDPVILALGQKRRICYMAKAELFKNKLFSKLITSLGAFPVERGRGDSNALDKGEQLLKEKHVMGIFIEGTRSKTGEFLKPKSGVSIIAYNCRVPVIPACITKGKFGKRYIQFGEPIPIEHLGFEEGGAKEFRNASRIIFDKIVDLRQQLYASLK